MHHEPLDYVPMPPGLPNISQFLRRLLWGSFVVSFLMYLGVQIFAPDLPAVGTVIAMLLAVKAWILWVAVPIVFSLMNRLHNSRF